MDSLTPVLVLNPSKGISMKQDWHCPHCGVKITTYVTLSEPPTHRCEKKAQRPTTLQPKGTK